MLEPVETKALAPQISVFNDWSLYSTDLIGPQLPKNIRYTPPKPNEEIRNKIKPVESKLTDIDKAILDIPLSFLEKGYMEDDFIKDDGARDKFYLSHTVKVGEEVIDLDVLAKRVNKLSGSVITGLISAGQVTGDPDIGKKSLELRDTVNKISREQGHYLISDMGQFDELAKSIIEHILSKY